ncbi:MAG: DUF2029 domain-containing protein [Chloroflexota bacterium]|nr:DUF2029 domain-containing protein [Chloroflexota bacterium]
MIPRALRARPLLPFFPALLLFIALWPVARPIEGSGDTFQFWYAGHLVATGASPYDQDAWHAAGAYGPIAASVARNCADPDALLCVWAYPPLTAWLFAPFGALPATVGLLAINTFVVVILIAGLVAAVLVFGPREPGPRALVLAAAVTGNPFVIDIRSGHFVGLMLLALVAIVYGLREKWTWLVASGAVVLALKPHVAIVVAVAVPAVLAGRRAWRAIASVAVTVAIVAGVALLRSPEALGAIIGRGGAKAGIAWMTTWFFAESTGVPIVALVVMAIAAFGAAVLAIRSARDDRRDLTIVAVAACLSLVVTPYVQPYDFLLTIPAFAAAAAAASALRVPARTALLAFIALCSGVGTWAPILFGDVAGVAPSYAVMPVAALVLLAVALRAAAGTVKSARPAVVPGPA